VYGETRLHFSTLLLADSIAYMGDFINALG